MIYTIGHSNLDAEAFVSVLRAHHVERIADVRRFPASRRHRHFNREHLQQFLPEHGIGYRHFEALGGRRRPLSESRNHAWREEGFRGYADYMQSPAFASAVEDLLAYAAGGTTAVMCAEALWWQCHRRLLADALVVRGGAVFHILGAAEPKAHELSEFARVEGTAINYPGLL